MAIVADADGDGRADLLVGAYENDTTGGDAGAAYFVSGPAAGDISMADATLKLEGESGFDWAGYQVTSAGDTDGDGLAELLVGSPNQIGRAHV